MKSLVLRHTGVALLLATTAFVGTGCNPVDPVRAREKKARDESRRIFEDMHKDADAEIRKYNDSQMQFGKTPAKEKKP